MGTPEFSFHIDARAGLELVFAAGDALSYPMHTHVSTYTITLVRAGTVDVLRGTRRCAYARGDVYVLAPDEPHSPAYGGGYDLVSLCVMKDQVARLGGQALEALCRPSVLSFVESARLSLADADALLRALSTLSAGSARPPSRHPDVASLVRRIETEPEQETLCACRTLRSLSPWHFIRRFRKETGLTPHRYLMQSRIRRAKRLLAGEGSIAGIAAQTGFCDQSHLDRHFKHSLGISPTAYRGVCFLRGEGPDGEGAP